MNTARRAEQRAHYAREEEIVEGTQVLCGAGGGLFYYQYVCRTLGYIGSFFDQVTEVQHDQA